MRPTRAGLPIKRRVQATRLGNGRQPVHQGEFRRLDGGEKREQITDGSGWSGTLKDVTHGSAKLKRNAHVVNIVSEFDAHFPRSRMPGGKERREYLFKSECMFIENGPLEKIVARSDAG